MTLNLKNRLLIIISLKFGLNSFWVEAVTKVGSSSLDASEPLPRGEGFKEVVFRVSGVRDRGCGFVTSMGGVD